MTVGGKMEYLDYYDENDNYLGFETREKVHSEGLWHKTVQNWLYTHDGKVIFQVRMDAHKLYTTSSGHVDKGESIEEAFKRETKEEIGLDLDASTAKRIKIINWQMDTVKKDGSIIKDRAKASVFIVPFEGDYRDFKFDESEVEGVGFVDAKEALKLFAGELEEIEIKMVKKGDHENINIDRKVTIGDFLVMPNETAMEKYGLILRAILEEIK